MVTLANILEPSVADQIYDLQRAAYSVEAQRIGSSDFPPLRETLDALRRCKDCFLVFVEDGNIVGCLSYEQSGSIFTITRLVVCPRHFRRGIASALLRGLESRLPSGGDIRASTADLNEPAIKAYEKQGYCPFDVWDFLPVVQECFLLAAFLPRRRSSVSDNDYAYVPLFGDFAFCCITWLQSQCAVMFRIR